MQSTLRAAPRVYISLIGIMSVPLFISIIILLKGENDALEFTAWSSVLPLYWLTWLSWFKLEIRNGYLRYRKPFGRGVVVPITSIKSIDTRSPISGKLKNTTASLTFLAIKTFGKSKDIAINVQVFGRENLHDMVARLEEDVINRSSIGRSDGFIKRTV